MSISSASLTQNSSISLSKEITCVSPALPSKNQAPFVLYKRLSETPRGRHGRGVTQHTPIAIDGNAALATFITNEGLSGEGTSASPYIIDNFRIDANTTDGIKIQNTDAHLIIRNCTIEGRQVKYKKGISLDNVTNTQINNNMVYTNWYGINLGFSSNNMLYENTVYNSQGIGIMLKYSNDNKLIMNTASYNRWDGVMLDISSNNMLIGNNVSHNNENGIEISPYPFFGDVGEVYSHNTTLTGNTVANNSNYGVVLDSKSNCTRVFYNSFVGNNPSVSTQATDDGLDNVFTYNYWDEWTAPDTNGDQFVDNSYTIDGSATNQDAFPLIVPFTYNENRDGDFDGDGMPNWYEIVMGLNVTSNDSTEDLDNDGLSNLEEYQLGTHPNDPDTDWDGLDDRDEVQIYTTDPRNSDSDLDDIPDGWEVNNHLNPLINDATNDPDSD
ncbi:MAG: nitrous oxide reductase family maturation protein NosD, partial [Candidatus Hodarchaeota archaeon]